MEKDFYIGVDVGNFDTKSSFTSTPTGISEHSSKEMGITEYLEYENKGYAPDENHSSYRRDKTTSDKAFILTLFAISKEIIYVIKNGNHITHKDNELTSEERDMIQSRINEIATVHLGIGLPPTHLGKSDENVKYYKDKFGDGVDYKYNGFVFHYGLGKIRVYPQDYAAILTYRSKKEDFPTSYPSYNAVDIGGITVDVCPIINGKLDAPHCRSLQMGILVIYEEIITYVDRKYEIQLTTTDIENVIKGEKTVLSADVISDINRIVSDRANGIIDKLIQEGIDFKTRPTVFLGGGSLMLAEAIKKNPLVMNYDFITDPNVNAKAFKALLKVGA